MSNVQYSIDREIPVAREADVVVVGGGPGGIGAAVMAAREGAETLLVERYGFLGGMAASGEVHPFMANHLDGVCLDKPVYVEWAQRIQQYLPDELKARALKTDEVASGAERHISKDAAMFAAEDLCREAGVTLLYHHWLADAILNARRIECVVLLSKSGFVAAKGKQYVDCTGDGDLAVAAGCEYTHGGPNGYCQPMTLCFKLSHVDTSRSPDRATLNRMYDEARERGEIHCPRENVLMFGYYDGDIIHFNTTRVIHRSGVSGIDLSAAEEEGRRQVREYLKWFRTRVPGYEKARIHSVAHHIGVRETRHIKGTATITRDDFEKCAKFEDAIARVRYPIDIHNPDGTGTEIVSVPEHDWYEIPYGCVVAAGVDNLTVGGRPISVDHAVHSSMRVMPPACTVGQAAGLAAATAARTGSRPSDLDGVAIRKRLRELGASL